MATCKNCAHCVVCAWAHEPPRAEQCEDFKDISRFIELPCGYAQTIYANGKKKIVECEVEEISFGVVGLVYLVSFECDSDCEGCPFNSWHQDYTGEYSCDGEYGHGAVRGEDFGKTAFLTREEAEKAITERGENNGN